MTDAAGLRPAVRREDNGVEVGVEVGEPRGALVVEVGERAALQHLLCLLADGEQARGERGRHVGLLADELGRVEPAPPRLVQRPRRLADRVAVRALRAGQRLVGGVAGPREGERLERGGGRVARAVGAGGRYPSELCTR